MKKTQENKTDLKSNLKEIALNRCGYTADIENKNYEFAIEKINKLIEINPNPIFYNDLCEIYIRKKDFYSAINSAKNAIQLKNNEFTSWFLLGFALKANRQTDEAIIAYQRALQLNPKSSKTYHNLGNIFNKYKNDPDITIECYEKVLELEPENTFAKSCLGTLYLKAKKYKKGWEYYEYSIKEAMKKSDYKFSEIINVTNFWNGENLSDKSLFVYFNGGLGDTIMFSRFLPLLRKQCKDIKFCVQKELLQLFENSDFGINLLDENYQSKDIKFDYQIPLMALGNKLKIYDESQIPGAEGYINADKKLAEEFKQKFFDNEKFKIGIKWRGNMKYSPERHFDLKNFEKLFDIRNTKFYSFQKGDGVEQLQNYPYLENLGEGFKNFAETAAALSNLDLVICNDTSLAHLAGAMGKACWVILPFIQDWRWSIDTNYTPWYKSIKMFKQKSAGNWEQIFADVKAELSSKIQNTKK